MKVRLPRDFKVWLVEKAEGIARKAAEGRRPEDAHKKKGNVTQLRNMIQITQEESEVEVLRNFIEYQAGRPATKSFWKWIHRDVIEALEDIGRRCEGSEPGVQRLAMQSFFGYMVRHFVYRTQVGPRPQQSQGAGS